jgi:hypothetical protein
MEKTAAASSWRSWTCNSRDRGSWAPVNPFAELRAARLTDVRLIERPVGRQSSCSSRSAAGRFRQRAWQVDRF